jgi:anti-sigma B factor antagonist
MSDEPPTDFDVMTRRDRHAVIVSVAGALDAAAAPVLDGILTRALADRTTAITIDVRGLHFVDSTGVAVLFRALRRSRTRGVPLLLCVLPNAAITRVLHLSGLLKAVPVIAEC